MEGGRFVGVVESLVEELVGVLLLVLSSAAANNNNNKKSIVSEVVASE